MRFKRQDLINSLEHRLEQDKASFEAGQQKKKEDLERSAEYLRKEQAGAYPELRTALTRAIRDGRPLYDYEIPKAVRRQGYSGGLEGAQAFVAEQFLPSPRVTLAIGVLRASDDEYVTSTALKQAGVQDIARLLPAVKR